MNTDLVKYYMLRAGEYEKIYLKPERQEELMAAAKILQDVFSGKEVFEVACGTGYWTEKIAGTARSILATDINEAVLEIARMKNYGTTDVRFAIADIFDHSFETRSESLFAGFIWSHIKKQELGSFLRSLASLVIPGGMIVLMDNNYVEGSNHPLSHTDEFGNTFQSRKLDDGSYHLVLKNFPDDAYLEDVLKDFAGEIKMIRLKYFWICTYTAKIV